MDGWKDGLMDVESTGLRAEMTEEKGKIQCM